MHLRPILPGDADALLAFHARLSDRTRYLRYFGPLPAHPASATSSGSPSSTTARRVAFICLLGDEIIAVGRYEGLPAPADPATPVDVGRGRVRRPRRPPGPRAGLDPARAPRRRGPGERPAPVRGRGAGGEPRDGPGVPARPATRSAARSRRACCTWSSTSTPPSARWPCATPASRRAEARSVHNLLHPSSVAVIGASTDPTKIGHAVLANLLRGNFTGPVYPVNPDARSVRGVRAYPSVTDIPDEVDLAVVAVPAAGIDEVMDSCLAKGVTALVVVSSGFADAGRRRHGRRAPAGRPRRGRTACGWSARTRSAWPTPTPEVRLNATLAPRHPGPRPDRVLLPVRCAGHRDPGRAPRARARACRRSSPRATGPTCPATTCCSTGRPTRRPTSSCSTWRPSATRASSPGWRGGWPARSRSSR